MAAIKTRLDRSKTVQQAIDRAGTFEPDFTNHQALISAYGLTPREAEVLSWVAQGKGNGDIAVLLGASEGTVKQHLGVCFRKMGVENRSSATLMAVEVLSSGR
jgi:DNA-binding CsgD family transcriptional regulator